MIKSTFKCCLPVTDGACAEAIIPGKPPATDAAAAPAAKPARSVSKQTQTTATQVQPQQVNPTKIIRQQTKGCSGCKRQIGK